jgi:hypothetical protein
MKVRRKSIKRQLQSLAHDYMRENDLDEIDLDEVTDWLIRTDQYKRKPITLHQQCKLDLARALKAERFTDENGNEIRRNHAIRIKSKDSSQQMVLWVDIKTAKPKPMRLSLQQRRLAILADCYRHSLDTEWYNEHNVHKGQVPLFDYDFNKDLEEKKLPTDYPEENPDD